MQPTRTSRSSVFCACRATDSAALVPRRLAGRLAAAALLTALVPPAALAAEAGEAAAVAARRYAIPAGPLEGALNRFGHEAGILLAFPAEQVAGLRSPGLHGRFDVPQALDQLLSGSGLSALRQPSGGYTLVHAAAAAGTAPLPATALATIVVERRAAKADSYRPPREANVTRSNAPVLDTAQAVNIVPARCCATRNRATSTTRSPTSAASPKATRWPARRTRS